LTARSWQRSLLLLVLGVSSVSAQADCDLSGTTLPVTMVGLKPLVPVKIEDKPLFLILDSGAFYSVLSPTSAAQLHLALQSAKLQLGGVAGNAAASITAVRHFEFGGTKLTNETLLVGSSDPGGGAAGYLGQNVLRLSDVEYDLGNGVMRLIRPKDCEHATLAYWASGAPYSAINFEPDTMLFLGYRSMRRGVGRLDPYVAGAVSTAYLNGIKIRVLFDTGAGNSVLTLRAAARAGITPASPGVVASGVSFGIDQGAVPTWIGPFESFRIGGEQTLHTHLRFGDVRLSGHADMLLGADFFLSHRIYVANSQRKIYFTYNGGPVFDLKADAGSADQPKLEGPEPTDAAGFARRGSAFASRRLFGRAIADFTRACELDPTEPQYFYQRGLAYRDDKQNSLALTDFDQALRLRPNYLGTLLARAEVHLSAGDKAAAGADLDTAAQVASPQSELRLQIAVDNVEADRFAAAIAQYDQWIESHADDVGLALALDGRCWARALAGVELAQAEGDCTKALHLSRSSSTLSSRGLVRLREGKYAKSLDDFAAALQQEPNAAWALYGRAVDERRLGRSAAADADLAAAAAAEPSLPERAKHYGITF